MLQGGVSGAAGKCTLVPFPMSHAAWHRHASPAVSMPGFIRFLYRGRIRFRYGFALHRGPEKLRAPSLPAAPPARHGNLQPAEPAPRSGFFHRGRNSDFALPPRSEFRLRFFARKTHHRASAEGPSATPSSRVQLAECFFPPFTRPAVNPGVGTGLLHSILAWAQDCPGVSLKTLGAQCCYSTDALPDSPPGLPGQNYVSAVLHSTALTYSPPTGLPHSILRWAQDCSTQPWHRIAPCLPENLRQRPAV